MHSAGGIRRTSYWCAWEPGKGAGLGRRCRPLRRCLMRAAVYARVSTTRQAQAQTIEQQLDRLHRNYVHQVLLIDELANHGCRVEFLDRPMSSDPHDQLLLQIRGAVAEYERTLIAERMRRGRLAKLRAGTLLPWTRAPFGYRLDPDRAPEPAAGRVEPAQAALAAQPFDSYLEPPATLYQLVKRLTDLGGATPTRKARWD